jgi:hypothetical protein
VAFVPPPAKRSSALLPLLIIAILLGGGFVAIYAGMKVFHGWQAARGAQQVAATPAAPAKPQANTTSAAALTPPLNPDVLLTQPQQTPATSFDPAPPAQTQNVAPSVVPTPTPAKPAPALQTQTPTRVAATATAAPLREPAPAQPQAAPPRALKGVAVAVSGDQALNGPIASVLTSELSAAGLEATDAQTLPATEDLVRGASASRLIERLREEGFASLLLARVEPAGERELSYMGRHDTAYSSRVTLVSYDLASGRPYGSTSSATIEYTSRTAERESEKVIGPLARAKAESMQRNSH